MPYNIVYKDELQHHGILGQKWGVRRYQNEDGTYTAAGKARYGTRKYYEDKEAKRISKVKSRKTYIGKEIANVAAREAAANKIREEQIAKSDGKLGKVYGAMYGMGKQAGLAKAQSEYRERQADYAITKLGRSSKLSKAYNAGSYSEWANDVYQSKGLSNKIDSYVAGYFNRPVKTWSGRQTTIGKNSVETALTAGIYPQIKNLEYWFTSGRLEAEKS